MTPNTKYWSDEDPKEPGWYLIALYDGKAIIYRCIKVQDKGFFYGLAKMLCIDCNADYIGWHKIKELPPLPE